MFALREWQVIRVDRNSRGGRKLRDRVKVNAEGVRITLLEGMGLYLIYLWIECPFRLYFAYMVWTKVNFGRRSARTEESLSRRISQASYCRRRPKA
jgi:hypothetical protein